jgi:biopolymer transport protein ExbD
MVGRGAGERTKRGIDMLPLLDVFMVVLFVFATIQESQLDSSVQELEDAQAALARAEAERAAEAAKVATLSTSLAKLEGQRERQTADARTLRERLREYERECGPRQPNGPACPAADPNAKAQVAVSAIHQRLLSNLAVFEVQLEGDPNLTTGKVPTRCCYRPDPPEGAWRSCGEVPIEQQQRVAWFEAGAHGLLEQLEDTKGESAVVLVSQGTLARYSTSDDLADLLRDRFPNHRVYDDGTSAGPPDCPAFAE